MIHVRGKFLRDTVRALIAMLAISANTPALPATTTRTVEASAVLADQWQALGEDPDQAFRIDETSAAGLFPPKQNGAIVVPLALLSEARTAGDVRAYLALRRVYRPDYAGRRQHPDGTATALGYLGLGLGYHGLQDKESDRSRPPGGLADPVRRISNSDYPSSDLDNAPSDVAPFKPSAAQVAEALGKGGCESDAVALLTRLAGRSARSGRADVVAADARRALHDLGMIGYHPDSLCDRTDAPSFTAFKALL